MKKTTKSPGEYSVVFVKCELDKETKERAKLWDPKYKDTFDGIDRMIADGYKISLAQDKYHDCVGCFATIADASHQNHGQCLTARGPSYLEAMKMMVFKHFQILDSFWGTPVNQDSDRDSWG